MAVWVSLLRGINLGKHNKVNMPRLREVLIAAGFDDVRTYVQSGNVATRSAHRSRDRVAAAVRAVVRDEFGIDVPVIVRSPAELRAIHEWCPFPNDARDRPAAVHVVHLPHPATAADVAAVQAKDWSPDAVALRGSELVIRYAETMQASTVQRDATIRRLCADGTARNWRTLTALVEMTRD